jgi:hypothetical protein
MSRPVTERDFRKPEFRDADPNDYEFRQDGAVVRKDRWETAIHQIRCIVGPKGREFEISDVVAAVDEVAGRWLDPEPDEDPGYDVIDVRLSCGSILCGLERMGEAYAFAWTFGGIDFGQTDFGADIQAWRPSKSKPETPKS